MEKNELLRQAWPIIEPELASLGYELVELVFTKTGHTRVLRVHIDKEGGGITIDDCTEASRLLDPILDATELIMSQYMLEVSSPGVERPVRKAADFERFIGEAIRMEAYVASNGRKRFAGTLVGFEDDMIQVECDGEVYEVHIENLKRANLDR